MHLRTGTIVRVTFSHIDLGSYYLPVTKDGMYVRTLADGREEIFLPSGFFVHASPGRVAIRSLLDSPFYQQVRAELFPNLAEGAEQAITASVNFSDGAATIPVDTAPPLRAA